VTTYADKERTMTSVTVSSRSAALSFAACQRSSGTRTLRDGVFGWFGMSTSEGFGLHRVVFAEAVDPVRQGHEVGGFVVDRPGYQFDLVCAEDGDCVCELLGGHVGPVPVGVGTPYHGVGTPVKGASA
jgi:hypothetical protein